MIIKSKWARMTADRIRSGTLTESQIRAMRRILANSYREGSYGKPASKQATQDEADALQEMVNTLKPRVSDEQARKGADWLYRQAFTPRGALRATAFAREFSEADRAVILQLRDNPHFTLNGFEDVGEPRWPVLVPVYNAIGADTFFRYAAVAWQTGKPFVIHHA